MLLVGALGTDLECQPSEGLGLVTDHFDFWWSEHWLWSAETHGKASDLNPRRV